MEMNLLNSGKPTMMEKSEQKTKLSKEKYGKNGGENSSHYTENQKIQKQAQPSPWVITPWGHQHTQRNCELLSTNPTYQKSPQYQKLR